MPETGLPQLRSPLFFPLSARLLKLVQRFSLPSQKLLVKKWDDSPAIFSLRLATASILFKKWRVTGIQLILFIPMLQKILQMAILLAA